MNLINLKYREDFGHEWYVQILNVKGWSLLQGSVSCNDFPAMPYLQITFGSNGFFSFLFWIYKFGIDIDIFSRTWKWDYLKELEEEDVQHTD